MNKIIKLKNTDGSIIEIVKDGNIVVAYQYVEAIQGIGTRVRNVKYFVEGETIGHLIRMFQSLGFQKVSA